MKPDSFFLQVLAPDLLEYLFFFVFLYQLALLRALIFFLAATFLFCVGLTLLWLPAHHHNHLPTFSSTCFSCLFQAGIFLLFFHGRCSKTYGRCTWGRSYLRQLTQAALLAALQLGCALILIFKLVMWHRLGKHLAWRFIAAA